MASEDAGSLVSATDLDAQVVLVVDDDPAVAFLIAAQLKNAGYGVVTALSGAAALGRLEERAIGVAIVDLVLPDTNGLELIARIKSRQSDVRVIILTGFPSTETALEAIHQGVFGYLIKPWVSAQLVRMVDNAFELRRLAAENLRLAAAEMESRRLSALVQASQAVTGSVQDGAVLEGVVRTVARALDADACCLRMLDEDGEHLIRRASHGLSSSDPDEMTYMKVDRSFAGRTVREKKTYVISDLGAYPSQLEEASYLRDGLRSLLCVPVLQEGTPIGSLTVFWKEKRQATLEDKRAMYTLANQITFTVTNQELYQRLATAHSQLQKHHERMLHELSLASLVQKTMLPGDLNKPPVEIATWLLSVEPLAGDFYYHQEIDEDLMMLSIGDVTGRGSVAAITMLLVHLTIIQQSKSVRSPARLLASVNEQLLRTANEEVRDSILTTAFCGTLNCRNGEFRYAKAAHDGVLWWSNELNKCVYLDADGYHLGLFAEGDYEEGQVRLCNRDLLVFYTDGITEAKNPRGERFGRQRLREVVADHAVLPPAQLIGSVVEAVSEFAGKQSPRDDQAIMVLKYDEGEPSK